MGIFNTWECIDFCLTDEPCCFMLWQQCGCFPRYWCVELQGKMYLFFRIRCMYCCGRGRMEVINQGIGICVIQFNNGMSVFWGVQQQVPLLHGSNSMGSILTFTIVTVKLAHSPRDQWVSPGAPVSSHIQNLVGWYVLVH